ncbi:MAG: hypothetical protein ACTSSD_15200, partial [Candidatus Thorarchaeota archaeon]
FDRPVPTTRTSQRYDTRSVAPFYSGSPWMSLVDEIIYNIPTAPRRYGSYVPVEDDQRWLVMEKNDDFTVDSILTPPLYKWGERFRPDNEREENIISQNTFEVPSGQRTRGEHHQSEHLLSQALLILKEGGDSHRMG